MCKLALGICSVYWFAVASAIIAHHVHWTLAPRTIWAWVLPIHSTYGLSDDKFRSHAKLFSVQESQLGCLLPIERMSFQMASFSCIMLKLGLFFVFQVQVSWAWVLLIPNMAFQNDNLGLHITISLLLRKVVCLFCLSHWDLPNHDKIMYLLRKVVCLLRLFCLLVMLRSPKLQPSLPSHSWYYWKALISRNTLRWSCNV
jgi:hypothetical protein